MGLVPFAC